jgi:hypothetical protein
MLQILTHKRKAMNETEKVVRYTPLRSIRVVLCEVVANAKIILMEMKSVLKKLILFGTDRILRVCC